MKKLNREQAQWLGEQFLKQSGGIKEFTAWEAINLIKQCTEKEFPKIHMRPKHVDDEEEIKIYQDRCVNADRDCIVLYSYEEYTHFDRKQFKQFADGINKIMEYLDEAE